MLASHALPPQTLEADVTALEKGVAKEARVIEQDLEQGLTSFGRGFTVLEEEVGKELTREQKQLRKEIAAEVAQAERVLTKVGGCGVWGAGAGVYSGVRGWTVGCQVFGTVLQS
jgi:hypothetical protein